VTGTSGFVLYAEWDILAGTEITVDYGPKWFADGPCPCQDCGSDASPSEFLEEVSRPVLEQRAALRKARKRKVSLSAPTDAAANKRERKRRWKARRSNRQGDLEES
jgi:hypothetical protein